MGRFALLALLLAGTALALAPAAGGGGGHAAAGDRGAAAAGERLVLAVIGTERSASAVHGERVVVADPRAGRVRSRRLPGGTLCHGPLMAVGDRVIYTGYRGSRAMPMSLPLTLTGAPSPLGRPTPSSPRRGQDTSGWAGGLAPGSGRERRSGRWRFRARRPPPGRAPARFAGSPLEPLPRRPPRRVRHRDPWCARPLGRPGRPPSARRPQRLGRRDRWPALRLVQRALPVGARADPRRGAHLQVAPPAPDPGGPAGPSPPTGAASRCPSRKAAVLAPP